MGGTEKFQEVQRRFEEAGTEKVWWGRYREGLGGGVQRSLEDVPRPCSF